MAHLHFLEPISPILNEKVGFQACMQGHQNKSSTYFQYLQRKVGVLYLKASPSNFSLAA